MFSLRALALIGLTVFLLPRDPAQQQRFAEYASNAAVWASGYCERNATTCSYAEKVWGDMKDKASFGAALVYDLALRQMSGSSGDESDSPTLGTNGVRPHSRALERSSGGTLTREDLQPVWRGHPHP